MYCVIAEFFPMAQRFFFFFFFSVSYKMKLSKWLLVSFLGFVLPLFRLRLRTPKNNPSICSASSKHDAHIQIGTCVYKGDCRFLEGLHSFLIGLRKDQRRFQSTQLHKRWCISLCQLNRWKSFLSITDLFHSENIKIYIGIDVGNNIMYRPSLYKCQFVIGWELLLCHQWIPYILTSHI